jgi:thiol-disulfide isomerase/thioredoxin
MDAHKSSRSDIDPKSAPHVGTVEVHFQSPKNEFETVAVDIDTIEKYENSVPAACYKYCTPEFWLHVKDKLNTVMYERLEINDITKTNKRKVFDFINHVFEKAYQTKIEIEDISKYYKISYFTIGNQIYADLLEMYSPKMENKWLSVIGSKKHFDNSDESFGTYGVIRKNQVELKTVLEKLSEYTIFFERKYDGKISDLFMNVLSRFQSYIESSGMFIKSIVLKFRKVYAKDSPNKLAVCTSIIVDDDTHVATVVLSHPFGWYLMSCKQLTDYDEIQVGYEDDNFDLTQINVEQAISYTAFCMKMIFEPKTRTVIYPEVDLDTKDINVGNVAVSKSLNRKYDSIESTFIFDIYMIELIPNVILINSQGYKPREYFDRYSRLAVQFPNENLTGWNGCCEYCDRLIEKIAGHGVKKEVRKSQPELILQIVAEYKKHIRRYSTNNGHFIVVDSENCCYEDEEHHYRIGGINRVRDAPKRVVYWCKDKSFMIELFNTIDHKSLRLFGSALMLYDISAMFSNLVIIEKHNSLTRYSDNPTFNLRHLDEMRKFFENSQIMCPLSDMMDKVDSVSEIFNDILLNYRHLLTSDILARYRNDISKSIGDEVTEMTNVKFKYNEDYPEHLLKYFRACIDTGKIQRKIDFSESNKLWDELVCVQRTCDIKKLSKLYASCFTNKASSLVLRKTSRFVPNSNFCKVCSSTYSHALPAAFCRALCESNQNKTKN